MPIIKENSNLLIEVKSTLGQEKVKASRRQWKTKRGLRKYAGLCFGEGGSIAQSNNPFPLIQCDCCKWL